MGLRVGGQRPRYYFKRQYQGRRYTMALGTSLDQARMKAQQFINAMERGDFSPVSIQRDRTGIAQFLDDALTAQTARNNLAEKSVAAYSSRVRHFLAYLYDEHPQVARLSEITPGIAAGYVEWRRRQKVSRSGKALPTTPKSHPAAQTVHDDVRRLRALFSVAVQREILHANPFAGIRVPVKANDRKAPPRGLTEDQARKLLMAASKYDRAPRGPGALSTFKGMMREIIEFYLLTGLRKQELVHPAWSRVDLEWHGTGIIEISPIDEEVVLRVRPICSAAARLTRCCAERADSDRLFRSRQEVHRFLPKNYATQEEAALLELQPSAWDPDTEVLSVPTRIQWRQKATQGRVPLSKRAREILSQRYQARGESPFVFPHPDGGPLRSDVWAEFKRVLEIAKLPKSIRLHDLRHTFGFTLRQKGVPLETIMGLMRHANIEETMVYARYSAAEGAKHIQVLEDFAVTTR